MRADTGFIRLPRSILRWRWYKNPNTLKVYLHLLLSANYTDSDYEGVHLCRGQLITGRESLARDTGLTPQQVRTALDHLKATNDITVKATRKYSIITVNSYDEAQESASPSPNPSPRSSTETSTNHQPTSNQPPTNHQPTINQQVTNNQPHKKKEKKEIKQESKNSLPSAEADGRRANAERIMALYNSICVSLPQVKALNEERLWLIGKAQSLLEGESFEEVFRRAEASDFLSGRKMSWRADFNWLLTPGNLMRLLEGSFDNRTPPKAESAQKGGDLFSAAGGSFDVSRFENTSMFDD